MNRQDLKQYKYTQNWIKDRIEYLQEYKERISNISQILSDMPRGTRQINDSFAEKIAELTDSVDSLINKIHIETKKQKKILEQIDRVEQPYRLILDKVYIQGKSLVTVASDLQYDYKYICKQHGIALNKFDEINTTKEVETRHINMI